MSEDEFADFPDDFADVEGVDWAALLAGPSNAPEPVNLGLRSPRSNNLDLSLYSDVDDMDSAFLAELDRLEQRITVSTQTVSSSSTDGGTDQGSVSQITTRNDGTSLPTPQLPTSPLQPQLQGLQEARSSHYFSSRTTEQTSPQKPKDGETLDRSRENHTPIVRKRARPEEHSNLISPKRKGKMKAGDELQQILSTYEDELTCPICCDILVASHVGNPCGHTFCGDCGWQWHVKNGNKGCPCCRGNLDGDIPMIPNIAMDNTVEKHVKALAMSGIRDWEPAGSKFCEWNARKQAWRTDAAKREQKKGRQPPKPEVSSETIQVFEGWIHGEFNVEEDPTYEDSDIELLPRPIRPRVRRRRRGRGRGGAV